MTVTVTWARPGAIATSAAALLGAGERARYARLVRSGDRQRYLAAHALARLVLGAHLHCRPHDVPLRQTCAVCGRDGHGRPVVDGGPRLSLAHAGDRVVVAVSAHTAVGVDVENPTLFATVPPAATLSAAEQRHPGWTALARARNWVCKEAALKAAGVGLRVDPRDVRLGPPDGAPRVADWPLPTRPALAELDLAGYPAAVAVLPTKDVGCGSRGVELDQERLPVAIRPQLAVDQGDTRRMDAASFSRCARSPGG